jgi:hypothetical protein
MIGPRGRIMAATLGAVAVALLLLIAVVLPAERGVDPIGTGRLLGLTALAAPDPGVLRVQDGELIVDRARFALQPFESIEYKYRLEAGAVMVFSWRATATVIGELPAEPDGAPSGSAETFEAARSAAAAGAYLAPYAGWHGWFWENRGSRAVSVELEAAGYFSAARTYHGGHVRETPFGRQPGGSGTSG